jgi:hypothetical protein
LDGGWPSHSLEIGFAADVGVVAFWRILAELQEARRMTVILLNV